MYSAVPPHQPNAGGWVSDGDGSFKTALCASWLPKVAKLLSYRQGRSGRRLSRLCSRGRGRLLVLARRVCLGAAWPPLLLALPRLARLPLPRLLPLLLAGLALLRLLTLLLAGLALPRLLLLLLAGLPLPRLLPPLLAGLPLPQLLLHLLAGLALLLLCRLGARPALLVLLLAPGRFSRPTGRGTLLRALALLL